MTQIARTLIPDNIHDNQRPVNQNHVLSLSRHIVILGEPGAGKSTLCEDLAKDERATLVKAGKLLRTPDPKSLVKMGQRIVIDGLDEVASNTPGQAVDQLLFKLAELDYPDYVLSCRVADWQGATNRSKLREDYGTDPISLTIAPLSAVEARSLLQQEFPDINAEDIVENLYARGLEELLGNPLSLILLGEATSHAGTVLASRGKILEAACSAMLTEKNPAHENSIAAMAHPETLLDAAGAIAASVLLTGNSGTYTGSFSNCPPDFTPLATVEELHGESGVEEAIRTRLFRGEQENCLVPIHRTIAEYLAARWIARQVKQGASERRLLLLLQYQGGTPTSLRGVHAWLAHFSPQLAEQIIKADPYGVLKYGECEDLSLSDAKLLLEEITNLAETDPYFRSGDWRPQTVTGLARPELKDDILTVLRQPDRNFHLSSLLLEAIAGSDLAKDIACELGSIMVDRSLYYGARSRAWECLSLSNAEVDCDALVEELLDHQHSDSARLAISVIKDASENLFSAEIISEAILQETGACSYEVEGDTRFSLSVSRILVASLPILVLGDVLDTLSRELAQQTERMSWEAQHALCDFFLAAIRRVLKIKPFPAPEKVWSWLRILRRSNQGHKDDRDAIALLMQSEPDFRRSLQAHVLSDEKSGENPWMRAFALDDLNLGLFLNEEDLIHHITRLPDTAPWTAEQKELWQDLIRRSRTSDGVPDAIQSAALSGSSLYGDLADFLNGEINAEPPAWKIEQDNRRKERAEEQRRKFQEHRDSYLPDIELMKTAEGNILHNPARAYLGYFSDLKDEDLPADRITKWLGESLAEAALTGFIATLGRDDLPSAETIASAHADNQMYFVEYPILCGIIEKLRRKEQLSNVGQDVLMIALLVCQRSGLDSKNFYGIDVTKAITTVLFQNANAAERYVSALLTPQIRARSSHINGLVQASTDTRLTGKTAALARDWLTTEQDLPISVETELADIVLKFLPPRDVVDIARSILSAAELSAERRRLWLGVSFFVDFAAIQSEVTSEIDRDRSFLWHLRNRASKFDAISLDQRVFIVRSFGALWPYIERPSGTTHGDTNDWDATRFIHKLIEDIGADPTEEASDALELLAADGPATYRDYLRHTLAQQQQVSRDHGYLPPTLEEIKATVQKGPPSNIDDLKAYALDQLQALQVRLQGSDVDDLNVFYSNAVQKLKKGEKRKPLKPHDENYCRDRLVSFLRPHFHTEISLLPEVQMAHSKRVDIDVIIGALGVPVEIKGQWHKELWNAADTQLDNSYTKDWRADGRGVYLVLWFGNTPAKNLPPHPDGLAKPKTPAELQVMLVDRLTPAQQNYINVVVLDLSIS